MVMYLFHGGCHGCTQQEKNGVDFCVGCQFFLPNWDLPNLSDAVPDSDRVKLRLKIKHNIPLNSRDEFIKSLLKPDEY